MQHSKLKFRRLSGSFLVCRLPVGSSLPAWAKLGNYFSSITSTADELSIVCPFENVPKELQAQPHWTCFRLEGPFPFSAVGILSSFVVPLAEAGIPIFAVSTYDTDHVLVNQEDADLAVEVLKRAGHELMPAC